MGKLCPLICLILTANGDTLLLAMSWGLRQRELTGGVSFWIAVSTSFLTALSLWVGQKTAFFFPAELAKTGAAALLMGLGLWVLVRSFTEEETPPQPAQPVTVGETLVLGTALAANNMGMGLAAGLAGMSPLTAGVLNFFASLLSLRGGMALGRRCPGKGLGRWADAVSGGVLMLLGAAAKWM